jgi:nitrogen-specific signal transduction histidine kinase
LLWVFALRRRVRAQLRHRAALEAQLLQARKLESVGRLAGGVAHDFNNLLTVIVGYSQLLQVKLYDQPELNSYVEEIGKAGERATALTQQLLAFSRNQRLQPVVFDLNVLVADMQKMLNRLIGEDVELRHVLDPRPCRVLADPGQMGQVLMNLVANARDAMPLGGELVLETRNVELGARSAGWHADLAAGRYVELAVTDTGVGMDENTRAHIFEPFFTTKGRGQGTGLGLATVFGIVKQSGGHIWVDSAPGCGSSFTICLPATDEAAARPAAGAAPPKTQRGSETILLVEDQEDVRVIVRASLCALGYHVLDAASPAEALSLLSDGAEPLQLLITDMVMPGMNGKQLAQEILAQRPGLRVLYMSGYTESAVAGRDYLQKPFAPQVLAQRVREILDRPAE